MEPDPQQTALTRAEVRLLCLVADGYTHREIAGLLFRSIDTVKTHCRHIAEKLGSRGQANMITVALKKGVIRLLSAALLTIHLGYGLAPPRVDQIRPVRGGSRYSHVVRPVCRLRREVA